MVLGIQGEDNMLVRKAENVREWFNLLQMMIKASKTRVMRMTDQVWEKKTELPSYKIDEWLAARDRVAARYQYSYDRQGDSLSVLRQGRLCECYSESFISFYFSCFILDNTEGLSQDSYAHTKVHMRSKSAERKICEKFRRPKSGEMNMRSIYSQDSGNSSLNNSYVGSNKSKDNIELWVKEN